MNLQTLQNATATFLNDQNQTRYAGKYTAALNIAQQQFAIDSKCFWKDMPTVNITSGQASYALPTDFMWEKQVMLNGLPLYPISREELARQNPGFRWDTITGTPINYNVDPDVAKSQLLLIPIPAANDAGKDLVLTYYAYPADMVNPTDVPFNNTPLLAQFHLGVAAWAAWYLGAQDDAQPTNIEKRRALLNIYNDFVSEAVNTFKNTVSEPMRMRSSRNYTFTGPRV